ncbi:hypothetical protein ACFLQP_01565 [Acidobacteriota bacterium]
MIKIKYILKFIGGVYNAVAYSLSPSIGASSREIRKNGAICVAAAMCCLVLFFILTVTFSRTEYKNAAHTVGGIISFISYVLVLVGGYRLLTGKRNQEAPQGPMASLLRILIGMGGIILFSGITFLLILLVSHLLGLE